eukprot:3932020-Rhodomonas_salina.2
MFTDMDSDKVGPPICLACPMRYCQSRWCYLLYAMPGTDMMPVLSVWEDRDGGSQDSAAE